MEVVSATLCNHVNSMPLQNLVLDLSWSTWLFDYNLTLQRCLPRQSATTLHRLSIALSSPLLYSFQLVQFQVLVLFAILTCCPYEARSGEWASSSSTLDSVSIIALILAIDSGPCLYLSVEGFHEY
jgi:hypothetical protein